MPDFSAVLGLIPQVKELLGPNSQPGAALAVITTLRAQGHDPDVVRTCVEQVSLRFKLDQLWPAEWMLTRDGAEQASHPLVAKFHARVISKVLDKAGIGEIVDVGAGIGSDSCAIAAAGLTVTAWERDQLTADYLAHNLRNFPNATARYGTSDLSNAQSSAYFIDPARRSGVRTADGSRALPERDPQRWSPPMSTVLERSQNAVVFMKAAPAFDPPEGWTRYCISLNRTLIEMFTTNAHPHESNSSTFAVMIDTNSQTTVEIAKEAPEKNYSNPASEIQEFIYEVDPAISRAQMPQQVATNLGLHTLGKKGMWLTGDQLTHPPDYLRMFKVHSVAPIKDLAQQVAHLPGVAIKNKDSHLDLRALRTAGKKPDHNRWAVVVTSLHGQDIGILVSREPITKEPGRLAE